MAFKKSLKNTIVKVANHWGPDKTVAFVFSIVIGAALGGLSIAIGMDNSPMEFIENNKEEN